MAGLASRIFGLAILAAFIVLFIYSFKYILWFFAILLILVVLSGLLFYFRMRLAVRRFQKAFIGAQEALRAQAGAPQGSGTPPGDVLDAEFKVKP